MLSTQALVSSCYLLLFFINSGFELRPRTRFVRVFFKIPTGEFLIVSTSRQTKTVWPLIEAMKLKPCGNLAEKCRWQVGTKPEISTFPSGLELNNWYCCGFACDCRILQCTEIMLNEQLQSFHTLLMDTLLLFWVMRETIRYRHFHKGSPYD